MRYTHAVVTEIGNTVVKDTSSGTPYSGGIDVERAKKDLKSLHETLRSAGVSLIVLPPEDKAQASTLFVEDCAVIANGVALITKPQRESRWKEVMNVLSDAGLYVYEMNPDNKMAKLEASDVLFTGREFFVGITKWTNEEGAKELARTFPEFSVTPIQVTGQKHLKHYVCAVTPEILSVVKSSEGRNVLARLDREATFRYQTLTLDNAEAANCLNVNDMLLYRKDCEDQFRKFLETQNLNRGPVSFNELCKMDGLLSQHCLLFRQLKLGAKN